MDNDNHKTLIRSIRRAANIGLYGSLAAALLTLAEYYLAEYVWVRQIVTNEYTHHLFFVTAPILTVVGISYILLSVRRQIPKIRQMDDVESKLVRYRGLVRGTYFILLTVTLLCCALTVILHESIVITLLLLLFFTAVMNYPNMYKMKNDMGLLDEEMVDLFGDNYIRDKQEHTTLLEESTEETADENNPTEEQP